MWMGFQAALHAVVFFHALGFREVNALIFLERDINELVGGFRCFFMFTPTWGRFPF